MSSAESGIREQNKEKRNDKLSNKEDVNKISKESANREARINYTLDMVVHDLVSQGHLHPAKSYLLKTPAMKEHIGRMCDQLNRRKKAELGKKRTSIVSKSLSTSNRPLNASSSALSNMTRGFALMKTATQEDANKDGGNKKLSASQSADIPSGNGNSSNSSRPEMVNGLRKLEPWVSPRDVTDGRPRRHANSKTEQGITVPKISKIRKQLATLETMASPSHRNNVTVQAYRAKVDMSGFTNEEISLDLDDRKLMITAQRAKKGTQNSRKVTEIIEIPEGVDLENLKIGRRLDGCLLIEEFVPGVDNR